jgi:hypothetical protein
MASSPLARRAVALHVPARKLRAGLGAAPTAVLNPLQMDVYNYRSLMAQGYTPFQAAVGMSTAQRAAEKATPAGKPLVTPSAAVATAAAKQYAAQQATTAKAASSVSPSGGQTALQVLASIPAPTYSLNSGSSSSSGGASAPSWWNSTTNVLGYTLSNKALVAGGVGLAIVLMFALGGKGRR